MHSFKEFLKQIYTEDETLWCEEMSRMISENKAEELDLDNLHDYLLEMAGRDRREVNSRLIVLLTHLLKTTTASHAVPSWEITIREQRRQLQTMLKSKVLVNFAQSILPDAYADAVKDAAGATEQPVSFFPPLCPWNIQQIIN